MRSSMSSCVRDGVHEELSSFSTHCAYPPDASSPSDRRIRLISQKETVELMKLRLRCRLSVFFLQFQRMGDTMLTVFDLDLVTLEGV